MGLGSSPLARGTPILTLATWWLGGLIPARAGNTMKFHTQGFSPGAHPRSRGEHRLTTAAIRSFWGSSPLARGTHGGIAAGVASVGLIPARAGNTLTGSTVKRAVWAHPRSRGEHCCAGECPAVLQGSSPLARGTPATSPHREACVGLIPARAGNTHPAEPTRKASRAHPRSRGEHVIAFLMGSTKSGSSPLARGTHQ